MIDVTGHGWSGMHDPACGIVILPEMRSSNGIELRRSPSVRRIRRTSQLSIALAVAISAPVLSVVAAQTRRAPAKSSAAVSAASIPDRQTFEAMADASFSGSRSPMPHVLFVIDRGSGDRVHFVDPKRFRFHRDFVNASYLSLERSEAFYERNYSNDGRRFLMGSIVWQTGLGRFTFEVNEGDRVSTQLLSLAAKRLGDAFYAPLAFRAVTGQQAAAGRDVAGLEVVDARDLFGDQVYLAINPGSGVGILRIVDSVTPDTFIDRNEIVILTAPQVSLPPVAGILSTVPPSPLSHLNVLARSWGVPNVFARGADETYRPLLGKFVSFEARRDGYSIRLAETREIVEASRKEMLHSELITPEADLTSDRLEELSAQRARDSVRYGAKSANLGEIAGSRLAGFTVPQGFTIPFSWYARFVRETGIETEIFAMLDDERFNHDIPYRRSRLEAMRKRIESTPLSSEMADAISSKARTMFGDDGLFVRSSTNAEDLPWFSGAGLYSTVPNVRGSEALTAAVRVVWASIWNDRAYEARAAAGMSHLVYPAVLVQRGMNADSAGVLVTTNPFDPSDRDVVFINAKRGLGIRVVDGYRVAEQILYDARRDSVRVLTRSADDTALTFDPGGGVREIRVESGRAVLTDRLVRRLARVSRAIERRLRSGPLDIEWLTIGDRIYIVQARPFRQ